MKLLSIKETVARKDKQQQLQAIRAQEIGETLESRRTQLNDLEAEFDQKLSHQQSLWAEEVEKHALWRNQAQAEVMTLENKRYLALLPLEKQQEELNNEREALEASKSAFSAEKQHFEELKMALKTRLDEVAERELRATNTEYELTVRKQGIDQQGTSIAAQSKELTARLMEFSREMLAKTTNLAEREKTLKAQTDGNAAQVARLAGWEQELKNERRGLQDGYEQLARSKIEILNK